MFLLIPSILFSQTDYSGVYYIASNGYNAGNTANNYYLCPTEGWAYYQATNDYTGTPNETPFLTTHKCRDGIYSVNEKAVWIVEKHPTEEYYYIKRAYDGKYMVLNGQIRTTSNANRLRLHLEAMDTPNDNALFAILPRGSGDAVNIKPKTINTYLTVNGGNDNSLGGVSGKGEGPTNYTNTKGIIGIYTTLDANSDFYLEPATIAKPSITNNWNGTFTITAATGATIYYTTDGDIPTTSTLDNGAPDITISQTDDLTVIKALAKHPDDYFPTVVNTYTLPLCETPEITVTDNTITMTCATPGASIRYTVDNTSPTSSSILYNGPFALGSASVFKAAAFKAGYSKSNEAYRIEFKTVHSSSEISYMFGMYRLASDFTSTVAIGTDQNPFTGIIDGQLNPVSGLNHPLVAYAEGAVIKNVIVDNVTISSGTNVGAICGEARGGCRIYNCGVLATNSTVGKDDDGYDVITSCSSTIGGSNFVGGIVGLLDDSSRVINCFSYANITSGNLVGGIVGKNNFATTATNRKTMVMNCLFYGEITGGTSIAPVYNGEIISNVSETGVSNYNFFRLESNYIENNAITKVYNCALGAETRFLQRFEFFRHLLNSHRELAAWWATDDAANVDEIKKWVMEPTQIGTSTPYPILKTAGRYASVVNYTPNTTAYDETHRNEGRKLTEEGDNGVLHVTIQMGDGAVFDRPFKNTAEEAAITTSSLDLTITDKDFEHFNYNYGKVQLPYYNDVGTQNYKDGKVVTGWKIVSISGTGSGTTTYTSGEEDVTYTDGNLTATPYNFADRHCTDKDLYDGTGEGKNGSDRIFNQGAYWDVPIGVTNITIEPYWGKAAFLADARRDVVYNDIMSTSYAISTVGGGTTLSSFNGQTVHRKMSDAVTALSTSTSNTVYDYAVVLVGNYHQKDGIEKNEKPYTVTTVDLDGDNEPDYSFMLRFDSRTLFHPVRYDFLNLIGLGMAQKSTGGTGSYNFGIIQPKYWFEATNTALFRVTQFEYSPNDRAKKPIILQGGVIEQWVSQQQDAGDRVEYFLIGGNVWFKEFHRGSHQDNINKYTPHPPVSVTGGDYASFYLTGLYQSQATIYNDNAECYINGGRFGEMAGAGMEGIGTGDGKGNITWVIDHADIRNFYGGGINDAKPVHGNIHTIISNSHVDVFCGGPKFGDMVSNRTVTTEATGCTFGIYFGAGYGGNAYNRYAPPNRNNVINLPGNGKIGSSGTVVSLNSWNDWVDAEYTQSYSSTYSGVSTRIDYQFIPMSSNVDNVCRLWVEFVSFSTATTHNVTSTLTGCTVLNNFYGGGSLGMVDGNVTSTLTNCIVKGNVYGAGYSASKPPVEVMNTGGFLTEPLYYTDLGTYRIGDPPLTTTYTWEHSNAVTNTETAIDKTNHVLYTTANLDNLGTVEGNVTLTLDGTIVGNTANIENNLIVGTGNVFGGGEQSKVEQNTTVLILGATTWVMGNVYGGGNQGEVLGNTKVIINQNKKNDEQ